MPPPGGQSKAQTAALPAPGGSPRSSVRRGYRGGGLHSTFYAHPPSDLSGSARRSSRISPERTSPHRRAGSPLRRVGSVTDISSQGSWRSSRSSATARHAAVGQARRAGRWANLATAPRPPLSRAALERLPPKVDLLRLLAADGREGACVPRRTPRPSRSPSPRGSQQSPRTPGRAMQPPADGHRRSSPRGQRSRSRVSNSSSGSAGRRGEGVSPCRSPTPPQCLSAQLPSPMLGPELEVLPAPSPRSECSDRPSSLRRSRRQPELRAALQREEAEGRRAGEAAAAEGLLRQRLAAAEGLWGASHARALCCVSELAEMLEQRRRWAEVLPLRRRCHDALRTQGGAPAAVAAQRFAGALWRCGCAEEAEGVLRASGLWDARQRQCERALGAVGRRGYVAWLADAADFYSAEAPGWLAQLRPQLRRAAEHGGSPTAEGPAQPQPLWLLIGRQVDALRAALPPGGGIAALQQLQLQVVTEAGTGAPELLAAVWDHYSGGAAELAGIAAERFAADLAAAFSELLVPEVLWVLIEAAECPRAEALLGCDFQAALSRCPLYGLSLSAPERERLAADWERRPQPLRLGAELAEAIREQPRLFVPPSESVLQHAVPRRDPDELRVQLQFGEFGGSLYIALVDYAAGAPPELRRGMQLRSMGGTAVNTVAEAEAAAAAPGEQTWQLCEGAARADRVAAAQAAADAEAAGLQQRWLQVLCAEGRLGADRFRAAFAAPPRQGAAPEQYAGLAESWADATIGEVVRLAAACVPTLAILDCE
eukprot:TRINITY_DN7576_c0_g1_i1.p1 TRINITY_DN7576_c0_g1~~TRINITY_DN7576_c0_g1_i1.p1  ORF type:complete len:796 (+),score=185.19 TRINITY_DN7576_c0_g1_i1:84-2390(+)